MHSLPGLVDRRTKLTGILLPSFSQTANGVLEKALSLGLQVRQDAEAEPARREVCVQLWLDSGRFSCTLSDVVPVLPAPARPGFLPSLLVDPSSAPEVIGQLECGHLTVAVCERLDLYLETGEPSVHALAETLLTEAVRVTRLGLPAGDRLHRLLDAFCALGPDFMP